MFERNITPIKPDQALLKSYFGTKTRVKFVGNNHETIVNIYIVYKINKNFSITSYSTPENRLFGAVILTENVDVDKYKHSGYVTATGLKPRTI